MNVLLINGRIWRGSAFAGGNLSVEPGDVSFFYGQMPKDTGDQIIIDCKGRYIIPGFTDVHVHLREPGFSYKETIASGTKAGARGGYAQLCSMPNVKPAPSDMDGLKAQLEIIRKDAVIPVTPYGSITRMVDGKCVLSDMQSIAPFVCAFSDDGIGVQNAKTMREAMKIAKALDKMIVAHCEDNALLGGKAIHDGVMAKRLGIQGISSDSEWRQVERDVELAAETGCAYHVCHVSTKESVEIIRQAKSSGINVSCETAPHYLLLCDEDIKDDGSYRMNPPIRAAEDRDALREALADGTIDMIATDHAPHSIEEKSKGLLDSLNGITGLEVSFPMIYTELVEKQKLIDMSRLIELMSIKPRSRFRLAGADAAGANGEIDLADCKLSDITVVDLNRRFRIDPSEFASKGKSTPFADLEVKGRVEATIAGGNLVWHRG